jgi:hypothetical protein
MRFDRSILLALALLSLAACAANPGSSGKGRVQSSRVAKPAPVVLRPSRLPPIRQPVNRPLPPIQAQALPGLESVIGATSADLTRLFGPARLDVLEGDTRKLQFASEACVLDVYLYPGTAGHEPQASYVDARSASDGKDVERGACIAALRLR